MSSVLVSPPGPSKPAGMAQYSLNYFIHNADFLEFYKIQEIFSFLVVNIKPGPAGRAWQKVDGKWQTVNCDIKQGNTLPTPDRGTDLEVCNNCLHNLTRNCIALWRLHLNQ